MANNSLQHQLVCSIKSSVVLNHDFNRNLLDEKFIFSRMPKIRQLYGLEKFCLLLFEQECGCFDDTTSIFLSKIQRFNLAEFHVQQVDYDVLNGNVLYVDMHLLGLITNAQNIISIALSTFGYQLEQFISMPLSVAFSSGVQEVMELHRRKQYFNSSPAQFSMNQNNGLLGGSKQTQLSADSLTNDSLMSLKQNIEDWQNMRRSKSSAATNMYFPQFQTDALPNMKPLESRQHTIDTLNFLTNYQRTPEPPPSMTVSSVNTNNLFLNSIFSPSKIDANQVIQNIPMQKSSMVTSNIFDVTPFSNYNSNTPVMSTTLAGGSNNGCVNAPSINKDIVNQDIVRKEPIFQENSNALNAERQDVFPSVMSFDEATVNPNDKWYTFSDENHMPSSSSVPPGQSINRTFLSNSEIADHSQTIDARLAVSHLPSSVLEMLKAFKEDVHDSSKDQMPDEYLFDEKGGGRVCTFLLAKDSVTNTCSNTETAITFSQGQLQLSEDGTSLVPHSNATENDDVDSSEEIQVSKNMMARRRKRRWEPSVYNGSNLKEDPDVDPAQQIIDDSPAGDDPVGANIVNSRKVVLKKNKLDELFDMMSEFPKDQLCEPCSAIQQELLPHQKMALFWMTERENTKELPPFWTCISVGKDYFNLATEQRLYEKPNTVNGGILADDMGLGKTLAIIALILTNHIDGEPMFNKKMSLPMAASEICELDHDLAYKPTKVSIDRSQKKDGYFKTKSTMNKPGFKFRQIYLQQLSKDKKKKKKKSKENTENKNSMFVCDSDDDDKELKNVNCQVQQIINSSAVLPVQPAVVNNRMFGEKATDRKSTLIVCPMSVLSNWTGQFQEHVNPNINLKIYVFYGSERIRDINYLKKYDVIITTYGTLTCDFKGITKKGVPSPLHQINWLRVVLDEGHIIRNAWAQQAKAAMGINAARRWILTGTPIQNRMTDLLSMVKFLRLEPFNNRKWWFQYVVESMKRKPNPGEIVFNRVHKLIKHMAIRRLKTDKVKGKPLVKLPSRTVVINKIQFSEEERKVYEAMHRDGKIIVCKYFRTNAVLQNYANILVIIMRLRQLCCHPRMCAKAVKNLQKAMDFMEQINGQFRQDEVSSSVETDDPDKEGAGISEEDREKLIQQLMALLTSGDSEECSICLENLKDPIITRCAHVFCSNCVNEVIESADLAPTCPLCRAEIDRTSMLKVPNVIKTESEEGSAQNNKRSKVFDEDEPWISSSKVDYLMKALEAQRQKDPLMKSLVVSQFTSFLDIIQRPLKEAGFHFVRLDGRMNQATRARVIQEFNSPNENSPTLMLLSLTAGGVGLNLTAASRVFLLDPAWNPAIEEQCFDRCHRLGQKKDVIIIKVIVENTVEDRMLILQQQKRDLMQKAFGMTVKNAKQRREAAMRDLSILLGIDLTGQGNAAGTVAAGGAATNVQSDSYATNNRIDISDSDDEPEIIFPPANLAKKRNLES